jgi:hypothetical protein
MLSWHQELEQAQSTAQILALARRFVASLPASALQALPFDCHPGAIGDPSDIDVWNLRFAAAARDIWGTSADGRTLYALSNFFLRASVRLSHMREAIAAE